MFGDVVQRLCFSGGCCRFGVIGRDGRRIDILDRRCGLIDQAGRRRDVGAHLVGIRCRRRFTRALCRGLDGSALFRLRGVGLECVLHGIDRAQVFWRNRCLKLDRVGFVNTRRLDVGYAAGVIRSLLNCGNRYVIECVFIGLRKLRRAHVFRCSRDLGRIGFIKTWRVDIGYATCLIGNRCVIECAFIGVSLLRGAQLERRRIGRVGFINTWRLKIDCVGCVIRCWRMRVAGIRRLVRGCGLTAIVIGLRGLRILEREISGVALDRVDKVFDLARRFGDRRDRRQARHILLRFERLSEGFVRQLEMPDRVEIGLIAPRRIDQLLERFLIVLSARLASALR